MLYYFKALSRSTSWTMLEKMVETANWSTATYPTLSRERLMAQVNFRNQTKQYSLSITDAANINAAKLNR